MNSEQYTTKMKFTVFGLVFKIVILDCYNAMPFGQ